MIPILEMLLSCKKKGKNLVIPSPITNDIGVPVMNYNPLTGFVDLYDNKGETVDKVNLTALELEAKKLRQARYALQCWKPCEQYKLVEDARTIKDLAKTKTTRILDINKKGKWFIKEEWVEDTNPKEANYKYFYKEKEDYPLFPEDAEEI